jgi:hypothetical protein
MTVLGSPPVVVAPGEGDLVAALRAADVDVRVIEAAPTGKTLSAVGIEDAGTFVLTDVSEATAIAVVRDANPDIRIVVYDTDTIPPFARPQADLIVDPSLVDAATLADELSG